MFILKQFLKALLLPPMPWLLMLLAVLIFWQRHWARKLLFLTFLVILGLHCGPANYALRYQLESRYPALLDPRKAGTLRCHRGTHWRQPAGDRLDPVSIR